MQRGTIIGIGVGLTIMVGFSHVFGGKCADGTHSSSIGKRGACSHHGGVSGWGGLGFPIGFVVGGLLALELNGRADRKNRPPTPPAGSEPPPATPVLDPLCPMCHGKMMRRRASKGRHAGQEFWGCRRYPKCRGIINIPAALQGPPEAT